MLFNKIPDYRAYREDINRRVMEGCAEKQITDEEFIKLKKDPNLVDFGMLYGIICQDFDDLDYDREETHIYMSTLNQKLSDENNTVLNIKFYVIIRKEKRK